MNTDELTRILLQAFAEEAPELLQRCERALMDLEQGAAEDASISMDALKRNLHSLKGSASAIGRPDLRDVCHAMEENLLALAGRALQADYLDRLHDALQFLQQGCAAPEQLAEPGPVLSLLAGGDMPSQYVSAPSVPEQAMVSLAVEAPVERDREKSAVFTDTIRVALPKIENLQACIGELVAVRLQQEDSLGKLADVRELMMVLMQQWRHVMQDMREIRPLLPKPVAARLDNRMTTCSGSLKTAQRSLFHLTQQMAGQSGQVSLLADQMDSSIRAIRMMPLGPFLESFRSVARDAARTVGKPVVLEFEDKGIEVDRLILQHIREPLLHLVRNAVSHGIESPAVRKAAGKPEQGQLVLRAGLQGESVSIAVIDDGGGFQRERIYRKALDLGLARHEEELTDERMLDLVTRPGFSTAQSADLVAGRGIGMDVVATMVYELGGTLELQSMEGLGACITLRVPASLATTQGLIVQVGDQRYGIMLDTVERIVRTPLQALATLEGKSVFYLDGQPLAVTSLAAVLGLPQHEPCHPSRSYPVLLLRMGSLRLAMIVDDIPGEIPMIVKPLGEAFDRVPLYAGGAILADGSVLPVIESRHVIQRVAQQDGMRWQASMQEPQAASGDDVVPAGVGGQRTVLVVDDSITTRTLERNILEAAGYRVHVATDGLEALDLLRSEDSISLLVTDLEMPRMNGLELCRAVRSGRHARLPIIMVTSIGSETEKAQGMQAGANAYIVKGNFQQDHFLSTVRRFVHA